MMVVSEIKKKSGDRKGRARYHLDNRALLVALEVAVEAMVRALAALVVHKI